MWKVNALYIPTVSLRVCSIVRFHDRMTASFHQDGRIGSIKLVYCGACTMTGKWAVMYLCDRGIDLASFSDFDYPLCLNLKLSRQCGISCFIFIFLLDFKIVPTVWYIFCFFILLHG